MYIVSVGVMAVDLTHGLSLFSAKCPLLVPPPPPLVLFL